MHMSHVWQCEAHAKLRLPPAKWQQHRSRRDAQSMALTWQQQHRNTSIKMTQLEHSSTSILLESLGALHASSCSHYFAAECWCITHTGTEQHSSPLLHQQRTHMLTLTSNIQTCVLDSTATTYTGHMITMDLQHNRHVQFLGYASLVCTQDHLGQFSRNIV
jgi:hypothetical protein